MFGSAYAFGRALGDAGAISGWTCGQKGKGAPPVRETIFEALMEAANPKNFFSSARIRPATFPHYA